MGRHALDRAALDSWSATKLLKEVADNSWSATELLKEAADSSWSDGGAAGVDVVGCCRGRAELTEEIAGWAVMGSATMAAERKWERWVFLFICNVCVDA
ncbi:hypothetical protein ACLOJK_023055 [Asimina triloba]